MGGLKEVPKPGLVKPETRDQIQARNREAAKALWAGQLTPVELAGVNAVCEAYGMDPLLKHIIVLGGNLYITVAGLRTWAYKQDDKPLSIQVTPATTEEKKAAGCLETSHYWKAMVWKSDTPKEIPFTEFGEADKDNVSLHRAGWKEIQDMAKTRAIGRALRNAYPVSLPLAEDMPMFPWDQALDITPTETPQPQHADVPASPEPTNAIPPQTGPVISESQSKRLFAISKEAGWEHEELKKLIASYGHEHTREILRSEYEEICAHVQAGTMRQTGEEG